MEILAIDPGLNQTGLAWRNEAGEIEASTLRANAYVGLKEDTLANRARTFAGAIYQDYPRQVLWVIELPQVYRGHLQKGDPNDLIKLSVLVGAFVQAAPSAALVKPAEWKGQLPKEVHHRRIREKCPDLPKRLSKDALDAVGLLLWAEEKYNA